MVFERRRLPAIFLDADLPGMATHCNQLDCGFSVYRGVLVQWDEDRDVRVLDVLDDMPDHLRARLLVVQEHEGSICFAWNGDVPAEYEQNTGLHVPRDGDYWCINRSVAVPQSERPCGS
jgi:hypothetical protein